MDKYVKEAKTMVKDSISKKNNNSPPLNGSSDSTPSSPPQPERLNSKLSRKELKKVTKRKTLVHPVFYIKFAKGFLTFITGSFISLKNKKIQSMYLQTLQLLLIGIAATYLIMILSTFPLRFILGILEKFGFHYLKAVSSVLSPFVLFEKIAFFVPMIFIGFLRYVLPSFNEDMFFNVLEAENKDLAVFLRNSPVVKQYPFSDFLKRFAKLAISGALVYVFSLMPYGIGTFSIALSQFVYSKEPLGQGMAFVLAVLSLHPSMKSFATHTLKALMASYSLGKELLEVYYCRVPDTKQEVYINRRYFGWLFGYSIACTYLLAVPYVGVSLWGIAQGSAAILLINILKRNEYKEIEENKHHQSDNSSTVHLFGQDYCKSIKSE